MIVVILTLKLYGQSTCYQTGQFYLLPTTHKTQLNYRLQPLGWPIQNALTGSNEMQMGGHYARHSGLIGSITGSAVKM